MSIETEKYILDAVTLTDAQQKMRRRRNIAIALILAALPIMFFASTIIRLGANVADRTF